MSTKYKDYRGIKTKGIYVIKNTVNGKIYIGSSSTGFSRRWSQHRTYLRKNKHHSRHLQFAWDKHGEEAFEFSVLEEIPEEKLTKDYLLKREQFWLDLLEPFGENGYNICKDASQPNPRVFTREDRIVASKAVCPDGFIIIFPDGTEKHIYNLALFCEENPQYELNERGLSSCARGEIPQYKSFKCMRADPKNRVEYQPYVAPVRYAVYDPEGNRYEVNNLTQFCDIEQKEHLLSCQSTMSACALTYADPNYKYKSYHSNNWVCFFIEDDPGYRIEPQELRGQKQYRLFDENLNEFLTYDLASFAEERNLNPRVLSKCSSDKYSNTTYKGWRCYLAEDSRYKDLFVELEFETIITEDNWNWAFFKLNRDTKSVHVYYLVIAKSLEIYLPEVSYVGNLTRYKNTAEKLYKNCFCFDRENFDWDKIKKVAKEHYIRKERKGTVKHKTKPKYTFKLTSPDGEEFITNYIREFAEERGLRDSNLRQVASGRKKHHKGWKCEKIAESI